LDKESSKVAVIIIPWGVYRFMTCPFGISTAPGEYQARMAHKVFEEFYFNGVVVYIDDTVIYGKDEKYFYKCWIWFWTEWPSSMSDASKSSALLG